MILYLRTHIKDKTPVGFLFQGRAVEKMFLLSNKTCRTALLKRKWLNIITLLSIFMSLTISNKDNFTIYGLHYNNECNLRRHFFRAKLVLWSNALSKTSKASEFFNSFWNVGKLMTGKSWKPKWNVGKSTS